MLIKFIDHVVITLQSNSVSLSLIHNMSMNKESQFCQITTCPWLKIIISMSAHVFRYVVWFLCLEATRMVFVLKTTLKVVVFGYSFHQHLFCSEASHRSQTELMVVELGHWHCYYQIPCSIICLISKICQIPLFLTIAFSCSFLFIGWKWHWEFH